MLTNTGDDDDNIVYNRSMVRWIIKKNVDFYIE